MTRRAALLLASVTGVSAVALGAFGAHALKLQLEAHHTRDLWNTAVLYHLVHSPVLLWFARSALALTGIGMLGAITPIGGLLLMAGWILIGIGGFRTKS